MAQDIEKHVSEILALIDRVIEQLPKDDARYFVSRLFEELVGRECEIEIEIWNARQDVIDDLFKPREGSCHERACASKAVRAINLIQH